MVCRCGQCRKCKLRAAQHRYLRTEKGKATHKRYRATAKGKANDARIRRKRIYIGSQYHGHAATIELAERIKTHIKERLREFKQRFADREETESVHARPVPPEAAI